MNLVQIDGTSVVLDAVFRMPEAILVSGEDLEAGRGRLFAYVSSADLAAIEALGAQVTVMVSDAAREQQLTALYALLDDDQPPTG